MVCFVWKWWWKLLDSTSELDGTNISGAASMSFSQVELLQHHGQAGLTMPSHLGQEIVECGSSKGSINGISSCKSCRERGVECDNHYPQCSQCFQEQLLCFYAGASSKKRLASRRLSVQLLAS
ncbi:hypothetical protein AJ79_05458 [Helicocarpus griseus UAMH5409]|uniref:Zn(2)-C6 fungal-type domain-containing protein n=1 Tax=Helicocarpus griseus UAMH5409 TaxID=1447875 RepID=A0A2B7XMP6_9EURO|nr:hypothetical protein AJ79_05458 [Helicocarpus griseus UAMH5409]